MRRPGPLLSYTLTAATTRAAVEAAAPALLLATTASGRPASAAALLVSAFTAASAVTGPVVGTALDLARRPRRLFVAASLLLGAVFAVLAAAVDAVPLPVAAALVVVSGLGLPTLTGGWTAQLPRVLPAGRLPRGYAVDAGTYNVAAIVGPALAAVALGAGGGAPLLAVAAIVVAGVATLPLVPLRGGDPREAGRPTAGEVRRRFVAGLVALVARRRLRTATVVTTVVMAGQAGLVVGAPGLSRELTGDLHLTGWFLVAYAVGGLAASVVIAVRPFDRGHAPDGAPTASRRADAAVLVGTLVVGAGMAVVAVAPSVPAALAGAALVGIGDGPLMTGMFLIRAAEAPESARAQVFTVGASLRTAAYALTAALLAPLADDAFRAAFAVGAGMQVLALLLGAVSLAVRPGATDRARSGRA